MVVEIKSGSKSVDRSVEITNNLSRWPDLRSAPRINRSLEQHLAGCLTNTNNCRSCLRYHGLLHDICAGSLAAGKVMMSALSEIEGRKAA